MSDIDTAEVVIIDREEFDYLREMASERGVAVEALPQLGIEPISTIAIMIRELRLRSLPSYT